VGGLVDTTSIVVFHERKVNVFYLSAMLLSRLMMIIRSPTNDLLGDAQHAITIYAFPGKCGWSILVIFESRRFI
jgi:hypothetical protein